MKRKNYWFLFAILLLSLTSLSPSFEFTRHIGSDPPGKEPVPPSQTPDTPESDLGPIQIAVQMDDAELDTLHQMNEQFMEKTGAEVEIIPMETLGSSEESLIQKMSLGEGPDVLFIDSHWIKSLAVKGFLRPIDASQAVVPDSQLLGGLLSSVQWNGYQWGIPFDMDPYVLAWQADEETVSELPSSRKSWQDFKKSMGKKPVFVLDPEDPYAFAAAVSALSGDPARPDKEILRMLAPPAGASWLKLTDDVAALMEEIEGDNASVAIAAYSVFRRDFPEGYRLWLPDYSKEKRKPVVRSRSVAVTSQSESSQLAMAWVSEMTSKEMERKWAESTGKLPALSDFYSITDSAINRSESWKESLDRLRSLLEREEAVKLDFGRGDGFLMYSRLVSDLLNGHMTVEEFREQYKVSSK
ncbi:multiple sugar transport system substrate-binding protein [Paenibacillus uliginis N3/975]|uniref:Multiple sugar transport system substrate-binding protein n=1 Tax=Paenibacillus uliginis N3/975 TaxID=1313296 RepID=A0A1X7HMB8_9BACL|nr:extracellular solute-binding protein [Paenibacillus uliginis]SMF88449.1 multiple sugar transport system substrate-binding protein [Paenibacillus uliginis N3/975]